MFIAPPSRRLVYASNQQQAVRVEWKTVAITERGSEGFALKLEEALTLHTNQGYALVQMIERRTDEGLVLMFQRAVPVPDPGPLPNNKEFS